MNSGVIQVSQKAVGAVGCENLQSKVFDSMYDFIEQNQATPDQYNLKTGSTSNFSSDLEAELNNQIDILAEKNKLKDKEKIKSLKSYFMNVYKVLLQDVHLQKNAETKSISKKEYLQNLIQLEMGNVSLKNVNSSLEKNVAQIKALSKELSLSCQNPTPDNSGTQAPISESIGNNSISRLVAGSYNVMTTAYQSCQVLELPVLSNSQPEVKGIVRLNETVDGIGHKRAIASLPDVQNTHPYIKVAARNVNGCFDVYDNPLIYDYGGAPKVTSKQINFHVNSGTANTQVLGIDCSAYVSSAIGAAGMRYKPGLENKPVYIRQTSSDFIDAAASGFSCFDNISVNSSTSILPGDIVAVKGHVVLIDRIGTDPLGILKANNLSQCNNLKYQNFNFTLSQSSPSKNGVGLNRFQARDYLAESVKMQNVFLYFAKSACQARFTGKIIKPFSPDWGIIRHKGTPECLAPRVSLANESCVSHCRY